MLACFLWLIYPGLVYAQRKTTEREIIKEMNAAAKMWNNGDLNGYMAQYDPQATMMMPGGCVGLDSIRKIYVKYYFTGGKPKQELSYDNYQFTQLGKNYGLMTGRFILSPSTNLPERTGRFSVVLVRHKNGWKILHDHSG